MMNSEVNFANNNLFCIEIIVDQEMIDELENSCHTDCVALKNEEFGIGVFFTQDGSCGVYGDDFMRKAAISMYWDQHAEEIDQAFQDIESLDDAIEAANAVIIGTIMDIMTTISEETAC